MSIGFFVMIAGFMLGLAAAIDWIVVGQHPCLSLASFDQVDYFDTIMRSDFANLSLNLSDFAAK